MDGLARLTLGHGAFRASPRFVRLIVKTQFSLPGTSSAGRTVGHAMQDREPISLGHIWSKDVAGSALPRQPAGLSDVLSRNRDDVLVLRGPYGHRARPVLLATMALAASFGLGWAGALNWPEVANLLGVDRIAHQEAPSPRIAEARSGGKIEGVRKTASTSDLRTAAPATVGSIPRPSAAGGVRLPADSSSAVSPPRPIRVRPRWRWR